MIRRIFPLLSLRGLMSLTSLSLMSLLILAPSCSGVKVATSLNKNADFSNYTTFNFIGWQDVDDELFTKSDLALIRESYINEFERRGLKRGNANADIQVSCYFVTSTESAYSGYNDYIGGRSAGFNHYYTGWGGVGYSGTTSKQQSKLVGTLIMNVYDGKTKDQIWQSIATGKVNENPRKDRSKTLPAKVASTMRKFPIRPV